MSHTGPFYVVVRTATPIPGLGSSGFAAGSGWGRYDSAAEAVARRDSIRANGIDAVIVAEIGDDS